MQSVPESSQNQPSLAVGVNLGGADEDQVLRRKIRIRSTVSKLKKSVLQNELESKVQKTTGSKDLLVERVVEMRLAEEANIPVETMDQEAASVSSLNEEEPETSKSFGNLGELSLLFDMMQKQQLASERRFQLQLEEIRCRSQEDRMHLAKFLADTQLQVGRAGSSNSGSSPDAINRKFSRLDKEARDLMVDLNKRCSSLKPLHEVEVILSALTGAMEDLKNFVDSKVDSLQDDGAREAMLRHYKTTQAGFYDEAASAKSYLSKLKTEIEQDKQAGCLPSGISPPVFYGDKMKFPTFWDAFAPLVHENPKVNRFYKMTYLKAAMKGEASGALDSYPTTSENYDIAIEAIKKRFGRNQAIIRSHEKDLLSGGKIDPNVKQLRALLDKMIAKKAILAQHNVEWEQVFVQIMEHQLPSNLEERWIRKLSPLIESDTAPTSKDLIDFLTAELATMEALATNGSFNSKYKSGGSKQQCFVAKQNQRQVKEQNYKPTSAHALIAQGVSKISPVNVCFLCSQQHCISVCPEFLKLSPAQRLNKLISRPGKVCFKCLRGRTAENHPSTFRKCTAKCEIPGCSKPHHKLLHVTEQQPAQERANAIVATICDRTLKSDTADCFSVDNATTILPTALAIVCVGNQTRMVRVGFDSFSQKSFITRRIADEMGMTALCSESLTISGFGGSCINTHMDVVKFNLTPTFDSPQEGIFVQAHVKDGVICSSLEPVYLNTTCYRHLDGLHLSDPVPRGEVDVDVLLGGQYYFDIMSGRVARPEKPGSAPCAIETMFGWILAGPYLAQSACEDDSSKCMLLTTNSLNQHRSAPRLSRLETLVERFWDQDAIGLCSKGDSFTEEERFAVETFNNSVIFNGTLYAVSLPFKDNAPQLISNYQEAYQRLLTTEKGLRKHPLKRQAYSEAINQYVEHGFAIELSVQELEKVKSCSNYFVPHHPIFKSSSTSTKVRIVFDASLKGPNGYSLNDCLLKGPNLLPDITSVLLRFRMPLIA